jgi:LuxR family transcriptional regulator, quorum-sensing system regulator BjaR1
MPRQHSRELTERELEALRLAAQGKSSKELVEGLGISKKTMDSRLHSAVYKLGARNRTHAVAIALRNKLIE